MNQGSPKDLTQSPWNIVVAQNLDRILLLPSLAQAKMDPTLNPPDYLFHWCVACLLGFVARDLRDDTGEVRLSQSLPRIRRERIQQDANPNQNHAHLTLARGNVLGGELTTS